ncbi:MAG TPA: FecR domain-containing protein [Chryseosolibacter sp.]
MSPTEFRKLLDRYFQGECSPDEVAFIEKWYANIRPKKEISDSEIASAEQRAWTQLNPGKRFSYLKIAAAVALLISATALVTRVFFVPVDSPIQSHVAVLQLDNEIIETRNFTALPHLISLSDGSKVTLEPNSSIRYPKAFTRDNRLIELSGEAFFDVVKDPSRPFIVHSNEIITKVLGTSFRITAFNDREEVVVAVKTGRVSVYHKPESSDGIGVKDIILTPNQQMVFKRTEEQLIKEIVPSPAPISPDSTTYFEMKYDGMPVTAIFEAMEANYGIDIQYDPEILKACILTTSMKDEGFHERIDIICKAINAEYTRSEGAVVITSNGCH